MHRVAYQLPYKLLNCFEDGSANRTATTLQALQYDAANFVEPIPQPASTWQTSATQILALCSKTTALIPSHTLLDNPHTVSTVVASNDQHVLPPRNYAPASALHRALLLHRLRVALHGAHLDNPHNSWKLSRCISRAKDYIYVPILESGFLAFLFQGVRVISIVLFLFVLGPKALEDS